MELPKILKEKLELNPKVYAWVLSSLSRFEPWIVENRMVFFDEYTDHSIIHVEDVIRTAVDLMTEEALEQITPQDAAVLIIGICFHDSAMHLSEEGFFSLVDPEHKWKAINFFDSVNWSQLWVEFLGEARRFDDRKLLSIFGDTKPVEPPALSSIDLSKRDRLLIGEFLRRHHPRLAHEIAINGVPGINGKSYPIFETYGDSTLENLSGLVARSHGMDLRLCVDYLVKERALIEYQGIHPVFLMVLLRVADYLQIQEKRAPSETLKIRALISPISQGEWKVHHCVKNITLGINDPEAIFIDARPEDIHTFLRIRQWISGIQKELDLSWAVLGEVYGRFTKEGFNNFTLNLRRIRSSIDDLKAFRNEVKYIPEKISFEASNSDLLKLLIGPLYGERPSIGVRELVQNSVDAVREMNDFIIQDDKLESIKRSNIPVDVLVEIILDEESKLPTKVIVTDKGVGMTIDILKNYFLNVGASFRKSDAWKKSHQTESGDSRVIRSGRFGVGALAAFLIGNEIKVTSRYFEDEKGFQFTAKLDEDSISISQLECDIGTRLEVIIPEDCREHVNESFFQGSDSYNESGSSLKFYLLDEPSLLITVSINDEEVKRYIEVPSDSERWLFPWRYCEHPKFDKIFWTYSNAGEHEETHNPWGDYTYVSSKTNYFHHFTCNGIVVIENTDLDDKEYNDWLIYKDHFIPKGFIAPAISLFDKNGYLPLNLQRTEILDKGECFKKELWNSILEDLFAYALVTAPTLSNKNNISQSWLYGNYSGFEEAPSNIEYSNYYYNEKVFIPRWFLTNKGVGYFDKNIINKLNIDTYIFAYGFSYNDETDWYAQDVVPNLDSTELFVNCSMARSASINVKKALLRMIMNIHNPLNPEELVGRHVILSKNYIKILLEATVIAKYLVGLINNSKVVEDNELWTVYSFGETKPLSKFAKIIITKKLNQGIEAFTLDYIKSTPEPANARPNFLTEKWQNTMGDFLIPFDLEVRKSTFSKAYNKLMPNIEMHKEEVRIKESKIKSQDENIEKEVD